MVSPTLPVRQEGEEWNLLVSGLLRLTPTTTLPTAVRVERLRRWLRQERVLIVCQIKLHRTLAPLSLQSTPR